MKDDNQVVYHVMDELAAYLRGSGRQDLADVVLHRVHRVTWTSRSELLEELRNVLKNALDKEVALLPTLRERIQEALMVIDKEIKG